MLGAALALWCSDEGGRAFGTQERQRVTDHDGYLFAAMFVAAGEVWDDTFGEG